MTDESQYASQWLIYPRVQFVNGDSLGWPVEGTGNLSDDNAIVISDHSQSRQSKRRKRGDQKAGVGCNVAETDFSVSSPLSVTSRRESRSDIQRVQASYVKAHQSGALKSNRVPTSFRSAGDAWDPYSLQSRNDVIKALLDRPTLEKVQQQVKDIFSTVPKSVDWESATKSKQLTPEDLHKIIRISTGDTRDSKGQSPLSDPSMESMITNFRQHAGSLRIQRGVYRHAERIANFIEYSLMRIQEFMDGRGKKASSRVGIPFQDFHRFKADDDRRTRL